MHIEVFLYYNRGTSSHGLTVSIILFFKLLQNSVAYVKGNIDEWWIIIYSSFFIINASQATVFENLPILSDAFYLHLPLSTQVKRVEAAA